MTDVLQRSLVVLCRVCSSECCVSGCPALPAGLFAAPQPEPHSTLSCTPTDMRCYDTGWGGGAGSAGGCGVEGAEKCNAAKLHILLQSAPRCQIGRKWKCNF